MTTQATTVRQSKSGMVALVGATALTVVALGGAAVWGLRPSGETAVPATVLATSSTSEGALPKGGLAERYDEMQAAAVTPRGGMAELYSEQAGATRAETVTAEARVSERGGMAELYAERAIAGQKARAGATVTALERGGVGEFLAEQAAARAAAVAAESRMGGLAELYRDQERERRGG